VTPRQEGYVLIAALCASSFVFQVQMKILADQIAPLLSKPGQSTGETVLALIQAAVAWRPILIVMLAGAMFGLWFLALMRLELGVALPLASIALVINAVGGGLLLNEAPSPMRIAGVLLVAAGVMLVVRS
jgi:drug/metabolite transporter (DMT)-like permease